MCTGDFVKHKSPEAFRILFVDQHNHCRSQMAEAIASTMSHPRLLFSSAGIDPRPIDPRLPEFLAEKGLDLGRHSPKSLAQIPNLDHYHVVVAFDEGAYYALRFRRTPTVCIDWPVEDPSIAGRARSTSIATPTSAPSRHPRASCRISWMPSSARTEPCGRTRPGRIGVRLVCAVALVAVVTLVGGGVRVGTRGRAPGKVILNRGSDTMINVAQAWAEEYAKVGARCVGRGGRRRIGRWHRGADRRHGADGQQQPADEAGRARGRAGPRGAPTRCRP